MIMLCAGCGEPFKREPLGHWTKRCAHYCSSKRYGTDLLPLDKDRIAYHQLTGQMPKSVAGLYFYGPRNE